MLVTPQMKTLFETLNRSTPWSGDFPPLVSARLSRVDDRDLPVARGEELVVSRRRDDGDDGHTTRFHRMAC